MVIEEVAKGNAISIAYYRDNLFKQNKVTNISYYILAEKDVIAAARCIARNFVDEPLVKHLNISENEFYPFAEVFCKKAVKDKLSFVAKNHHGNIIGCVITEDMYENITLPQDLTPKFQPILAILEQLTAYALDKFNLKFKKNEILHGVFEAVDRTYRGTDVAANLIATSVDIAMKRGYKYYYSEVAPAAYKMLNKVVDYKSLNSIKYKDFLYCDYKPFAGLEGEVKAVLLWPKKEFIETYQSAARSKL